MSPQRLLFAVLAIPCLSASAPGHPDDAAVLAELNRLRNDPQGYAAGLAAYRQLFTPGTTSYRVPDDPVTHLTQEGTRAVDEAIAAVRGQAPLPPLAEAPILGLAARDFVVEQGPKGATGHRGAGNTGPGDRVKRRGGGTYIAETISYGSATPVDVVRQLVVDDGVASRGHRKILLSPEYSVVGIWCGPHAQYRTMCVLDFGVTPDGAYRP